MAGVAAQELSDSDTVQIPDRGWVRMAAVCNADPENITCWTPSGLPAPKVAELMNAYYLVNSQQHLEIRYKHRSLLLVVKSLFANQPGRGVNLNSLDVGPGSPVYQQVMIGFNTPGEETTTAYWYYPADELDKVDVSATLSCNTDSVKVPLQVGAEARLEGGSVRITAIEKATNSKAPRPYPGQPAGPRWTVRYVLEGSGDNPVTTIYATPMDKDGNVVNRVDSHGNPTSERPGGLYYESGLQPYFPIVTSGDGVLTIAVNPDEVGWLQVTGNISRKVTFKNVLLRPRQ